MSAIFPWVDAGGLGRRRRSAFLRVKFLPLT